MILIQKKNHKDQKNTLFDEIPQFESKIFLLEMAVCWFSSIADLAEIVNECWALCSDNQMFITTTVDL